MICDALLLELNFRGFIPGPSENEEEFLKRIQLSEDLHKDCIKKFNEIGQKPPFPLKNSLKRKDWDWARVQLAKFYGTSPDWISAFKSSKKLFFWQAGMTWILEIPKMKRKFTLIQIGKKKWFLDPDEILVHEAVHAMRSGFDEPVYEEIFSYLTSNNLFRKTFGPIVRKNYEPFVFLLLFIFGFWGRFFFEETFFASLCLTGAGSFLAYGLFRLCKVRNRFKKAFNNLVEGFKDKKKALSVLFRLADEEIDLFSQSSFSEIQKFADKRKSENLRWRLIHLAYFQNSG